MAATWRRQCTLVSESGCGQSELEQAMKVLEEKHLEAEEYDLYDPYG